MENGKTTNDELAVMVKVGFDGVSEQFHGLANSMSEQFREVNMRLDKLESGQEDIKLRLDNTAHRFEVVVPRSFNFAPIINQ